MSDPKTPKDTPENQVSDTDQPQESPKPDTDTPETDQIEDAEILDEQPGEVDTAKDRNSETAQDPVEPVGETSASDETTSEAARNDTDADTAATMEETRADEIDRSHETPSSDPEPASEPQAAEPVERVVEKKGGFMGPFLGGVVAAGIGFGLCYYLVDQGILASGDPDPFAAERAQISNLENQIAAMQSEIAAAIEAGSEDPRMDAVVGSVESVETALAEIQGEVGAVQSEISAQSDILANLESQMEAIAALPEGTGSADTAAMAALQATLAQQQAENEAMQAQLAEMAAAAEAEMEQVRAQAGALQNETQAAVDAATNRAALANIAAALENGAPLAASLDNLTVEAPEALSAVSASGVETLLDLQRQFPAAARAGLAESLKATVSDDPVDRAVAFLRAQVGARSLEPREGDDPDAVLSRAQEAVSAGQLEAALAEISTLPDAGQAAMAPWIGAAEARVAALAAFDTLAAELNSN
ncbi:hypothetical protein Dshi_3417 [Dinoroseobacter shibae DFL 12 = DSM 16493]|uniref:Mitochondrial inner membrane protein n=1 Tax=Dinoroseobacter shibae (strain DSM 16493 / NCIMB 14021 / DFL 12) TaxID=398580 RepID=A8LP85_DINSH|nr:hypothetical protein [Dinoroseobacter shibae]ABV95150.1 hypothetical protein Dshi_3417 [Dinoroseobacter shibae DFL 12 = DSM 16493]URF46563.1 hypothetical protein M8008_17565 [Dinoroseobacter shibae]URF50869.1 hypothetical protein M8007_17565 [Dinoroseobacter shibae]